MPGTTVEVFAPSPDGSLDWGGNTRYKSQPHINVTVQFARSIATSTKFYEELVPNPYAVLKCGNVDYRTNTAKKTSEPVWDQSFTLLITLDANVPKDSLHLELWDKHTFQKDTLIGVGQTDLKNLYRSLPTEVEISVYNKTNSNVRTGVVFIKITAINFGDKLFDNEKEDRYTVKKFEKKDRLGPFYLIQDKLFPEKDKYLIRLIFNNLGGVLNAYRKLWSIKYLDFKYLIDCQDLFISQRGDENLEIAYLLYFVTNSQWQSDLSTLLVRYRENDKTLPRKYIRDVTHQVTLALEYMHKCNFIHGELRATNVLIMDTNHICVNTFTNTRVHGATTDTHFRAPESLNKSGVALTTASDMFSLGILMYELCTLHKRVQHASLVLEHPEGEYGEKLANEALRDTGDDLIAELIKDLIKIDPINRLTASDVLKRLDPTRGMGLWESLGQGLFVDVTINS
ncbi:serine/threonine-protein kinase [Acrasis kona]|uniref:Serine/threonine-protein kinase n=1 Tax=Acrasis kona TaxID=1008807 RepID=A0AAW2ZK41_9EUKA